MYSAESRNQAIISAILEKEKSLCPGSIALIGVYGSFLTGDTHLLSDLDLLILINDDRGWQLGATFVQDDIGVGHDLYCTTWENLVRDAAYEHPHISKLMDSKIVYCADKSYMERLESLRAQVRQKLAEPFDESDYMKAENRLNEARCCYAKAMIAEDLAEIRNHAGDTLNCIENALAMLNKTYFCMGVRRRYEELQALAKRPPRLCETMDAILNAVTAVVLKEHLTTLMRDMTDCFMTVKQSLQPPKKPVSAAAIRGTYEEMFSNWHGKMVLAAQTSDRHMAFMSLGSLNAMLEDIGNELDIDTYNALSVYDPEDLMKTAEGFNEVLQDYLEEYRKAGITAKHYPDLDAFIASYLNPDKPE